MMSEEKSEKEELEKDRYCDSASEEFKKRWSIEVMEEEHPPIMELVEALGYETIYDALVAIIKEKGLWKEEWDNGGIMKK